jgi:DnaJ-class molecular chaperone
MEYFSPFLRIFLWLGLVINLRACSAINLFGSSPSPSPYAPIGGGGGGGTSGNDAARPGTENSTQGGQKQRFRFGSRIFGNYAANKTFAPGDGGADPKASTASSSRTPDADRDYYSILRVTRAATQDEIKKSYRNIAKTLHPDKGGDPEEFKRVNEAYSILSDPSQRRRYDQYGARQAAFSAGEEFAGPSADDITDILFQRFASFALPVTMKVEMTLEDIYMGKSFTFGDKAPQGPLTIDIPPGVADNYRVLLRKGYLDSRGIARDIILQVQELPHEAFYRRGCDLLTELRLTLGECLLGFNKSFVHLSKKSYIITRSPGVITSPYDILKIPGKGMPVVGSAGRFGDLYLKVRCEFPAGIPQDKSVGGAIRRLFSKFVYEKGTSEGVQGNIAGDRDPSSAEVLTALKSSLDSFGHSFTDKGSDDEEPEVFSARMFF